jgi:ADP-heptose:LPS heptosyltransferase
MPPASSTPSASPRILAIRRRYLGDLVLLGSVFRNLRLHWPKASLHLLTETGYAAVATLNPDIDAIHTFSRRLHEWPAFLRRIRAQRFTHVLDFDNSDKTALTTWLTRAGRRVTQKRDTSPFRRGWAYTNIVPIANSTYETTSIVDTYLALLQPLQVPVATRESKIVSTAADLDWADKILGISPAAPMAGPSRLLVHPGSRSRFRIWPADRFAAVCDRVQDELDVQVFIVAGPGERSLAQKIREQAQSHVVVIDQNLRIGQLAALAARCGVMLCHDSGPMHVAAASGARVVALFGSQNATIWRPIGDNHTVLQTELPCTCLPDPPIPCVRDDSYRSYCVRKLGVDEVLSALRAQLRR